LGVEAKKGLSTPGIKPSDAKDEEGDDENLEPMEATCYRAAVARGNYLSQDRSDVKYTVKELSRHMGTPRVKDAKRLIRFAKYLLTRPRHVTRYDYQRWNGCLNIWSDTDYAGCRETRKSTSGGLITIGDHVIRFWSSTQKVIALSSGEAEYYGMVRAAAEGIGSKSILADMHVNVKLKLMEDSSAAKGIAERTGLGKVRHIEVNQLWLQQKVRSKEIQIVKVDGTKNLADALTKYLAQGDMEKHVEGVSCYFASGRHELMPQVSGSKSVDFAQEDKVEDCEEDSEEKSTQFINATAVASKLLI
jgi:hypothetical protein